MAQITATITDDVVKKIDLSASQKGISRSRWVALAIDAFLVPGAGKGDPAMEYTPSGDSSAPHQDPQQGHAAPETEMYQEQERMREEVQRLTHEVESKNQVIRLQYDEISWLRGECAKMTDHMLIALPPPREHWWQFWKKKT
jgi:hypothetical protein